MTDQPRLLDAYRRSREALSPVPRPSPSTVPSEPAEPGALADGSGSPPWTSMAAALEEAGWASTVRMGRRIWCRSRDDPACGWKSEEMAYMWMKRGEQR